MHLCLHAYGTSVMLCFFIVQFKLFTNVLCLIQRLRVPVNFFVYVRNKKLYLTMILEWKLAGKQRWAFDHLRMERISP